jgi:hypothetical protein
MLKDSTNATSAIIAADGAPQAEIERWQRQARQAAPDVAHGFEAEVRVELEEADGENCQYGHQHRTYPCHGMSAPNAVQERKDGVKPVMLGQPKESKSDDADAKCNQVHLTQLAGEMEEARERVLRSRRIDPG